jgi:hypothetical protein
MPRRALLALLAIASPAVAATLSASLPPGVPDGAALGWEHVTGDVVAHGEGAIYEFYVNPARGAIYEVVRYRLTRGGHTEEEKLVWNRLPRGKGPTCFTHESNGTWRQLHDGSQEYKDEMTTTIRVYMLHRRARLGG